MEGSVLPFTTQAFHPSTFHSAVHGAGLLLSMGTNSPRHLLAGRL